MDDKAILKEPTSSNVDEFPIVEQPSGNIPLVLGPVTSITRCSFCKSVVMTTIKHRVTSRTHMTAALCCLVCCCCTPYCCSSAKNTDHYCPSCQAYLGTYEK
ncbi:lipopolysaccharide-induced tumor necrosis factor-alpha factor homolog [Danaus plexippus]|uniref:lipopolysaccharide-induced tumor necrosis factor-alpha factor homolog n=1 Tax=Danaus plexippus TaxID=13037 RepID=UPI002AB2ACE1|nr:lipopolysaccharide-induced tumor necrosis factor-alpha factor homolog [Danaus plexippus]